MGQQIKVLLVDDHTLFRQGLHQLLELEGDISVVGEAQNGLEVEQLYHQLSPDVVLMDLAMPLLDGVEATRALLHHDPRAKVLALTMVAEERKVLEAIRAGARGYVLKDCQGKELAQAVRAVARGEGYFSPPVAALIGEGLRRPPEGTTSRPALTSEEVKLLSLLAQGMSNEEIARRLLISPKTVRNRISLLFDKLRLKNRTQAALFALKEGIVPLEQVRLP